MFFVFVCIHICISERFGERRWGGGEGSACKYVHVYVHTRLRMLAHISAFECAAGLQHCFTLRH